MNEREIFTEALQRSTDAERSEFLGRACGDDTALRERIEALLSERAGLGDFLEHSPLETVAAGMDALETVAAGMDAFSSPSSWPSDVRGRLRTSAPSLPFLRPCDKPDRIGVLGQYEIIDVIGYGSMGVVLRAMDTRLHRIVAIKVLPAHLLMDDLARRRFRREAQAAAAISHPHVVTIHAVDEEKGVPFFVMELVEGQSLQQKIEREGALTLREVLRIGSQAAWGLAAAHQQGLVHRDFKPANILLEDHAQRVKLSDFGLVRVADDPAITTAGQISGTPQYMAPEQAVGLAVDCRADLFSLGCVLYTMCTGRVAFGADTSVGVLRRVCDDTPAPIRDLNPNIPEWLVALIERLMEKNPAERIQSAAEVATRLEQQLARMQTHDSGLLEPAAPAGASPPAAGRRRAAAALLAITVAAVLLLTEATGLTNLTGWFIRQELSSRTSVDDRAASVPPTLPAVPSNLLFTAPDYAWTTPVDAGQAPVSWGMHLSADGRTLLFAILTENREDENLWMISRAGTGAAWSEPVNLGNLVNSPMPEGSPCLSGDGLILIFESQRDGGHGASDLWMCRRSGVSQPWSIPQNLGPVINTELWERCPTLSRDGLTLLYTTTMHGRVGNFLMRSTRKSVDEPWPAAKPVQLGGDERSALSPAMSPDGLTLFLGADDNVTLLMCTRASTADGWNAPVTLPFQGRSPNVTEDGRGVMFSEGGRLMVSHRIRRH